MNLRELRARNSGRFHPNQDWFNGEAFMEAEATCPEMFTEVTTSFRPTKPSILPKAVDLAWLYLHHSHDPIWSRYLWTADVDRYGQRVYVGDNGKGLEIHRHLHITERWACPVWS